MPSKLFGGNSFTVSAAITKTGGSIESVAETGHFFIQDVPNVQLSPINGSNNVWRAGQTKYLQCIYRAQHVGDTWTVYLGFADGNASWPGESYGFVLATGTFTDEANSISIPVTVPTGTVIAEHQLQIRCSNESRSYFGPIYVGSSNVPVVASIKSMQVELPIPGSDGQVRLVCEGLQDTSYIVEESTNIVTWQALTNTPQSSPSGGFNIRHDITDMANHFYRMKQVP